MQKNKAKSLTGFSLIEVLVSIAIFTFIVTGIYGVLNVGAISYNTDMCLLDLHQYARHSANWMTKELRETAAEDIAIVVIDVDDARITFDTPNETGIQFYRDIGDINSDSITKQIIREYPSGTYRILANDIGNLSFCCVHDGGCDDDCSAANVVRIQLTADRTVLGRDLSFPVRVKVRVRNE